MNIRFNARNEVTNTMPLRVVISHKGKTYRKAIGISVSAWDNKKQKCGHVPTDLAIKAIRIGLESVLDEYSDEKSILGALERIERGKWTDEPTIADKSAKSPEFDQFFYDWAHRNCHSRKHNVLSYKLVTDVMGTGYGWNDLDSAYYVKLIQGFDKKGMRPNYQGMVIGKLKTCLNEAYALHYMTDDSFRKWEKPKEDTFAVALTQDECDRMWSADLSGAMAHTRDLAIVGIYTAARFSDYSRLTKDNIVDGRISFVQEKTDKPVLIPCSPKIIEVMNRNKGRVPKMCSQVFNRNLKELCKQLKIDTVVEVPQTLRTKLGKKKNEKVYKYELISSHTCRRTGASLLYKSGVPIRICRYLTGHTKDETFLKYIKIDIEEGADILSKNDFFK